LVILNFAKVSSHKIDLQFFVGFFASAVCSLEPLFMLPVLLFWYSF